MSSHIKNKIKRIEVYRQVKHEKKKLKKKERLKRQREVELLGEEAPKPQKQKTLDNTREKDETWVDVDDEEVEIDEANDEMAPYFTGVPPKILLTSSIRPTKCMYKFLREMLTVFPGTVFTNRKTLTINNVCQQAAERGFTEVMIWEEDKPRKQIHRLILCRLPDGPSAEFKVTNVVPGKSIKGHGRAQQHHPEIVLNNFNTRLGRTVARMFACLGPQDPNFKGRSVITMHNQRDFIFFRRHRYIFDSKDKARLQELGPRFTLKLMSVQKGRYGDPLTRDVYLWKHKPEMDTSRRRFFL